MAPLLEPALLRRLEALALQVRRAVSGQLAGAIAYVALAALDRVRLTVFAEGETSGGAPSRGRRAAATLFSRLQSFPAGGVTNYEKLVWPIGRQLLVKTASIT